MSKMLDVLERIAYALESIKLALERLEERDRYR